MSDVWSFLRWVFVLEVAGFLGLSITSFLFPRLKDQGAGIARLVGLLVVAYPVWLSAHWAPIFESGSIVVALFFVGIVSLILYYTDRSRWRQILSEPGELLLSELVWWSVFLVLTTLRAYNPDIVGMSKWGGCEKFMDMNFVGGILNSRQFPPGDNWLAGFPINYYYYGYYLCAVLIQVTGVLPHVGYNLMLITVYALAIHAVWGLLRNLGVRWYWCLWAIFLGFFATNLKAAGLAWKNGIIQAHEAMATSRVIDLPTDHTINEYPIFTFMWGDLHGHLSGMALQMGVLGICWGWVLSVHETVSALRRTLGLLLLAVSFGSLCVTNAWDIPAYSAVVLFSVLAGTSLLRNWKEILVGFFCLVPAVGVLLFKRFGFPLPVLFGLITLYGIVLSGVSNRNGRCIVGGHLVLRVAVILSPFSILFLPFFHTFVPPTSGFNLLPGDLKSPLGLFLLIFGPHLVLLAIPLFKETSSLVLELLRGRSAGKESIPGTALSTGRILFGVTLCCTIAGLIVVEHVSGGLSLSMTPMLLVVFLFMTVCWLLGMWIPVSRTEDEEQIKSRFVSLLLILGIGLILGCEFVAVKDFYGESSLRFNTVFKFHIQAWLLLAVCIGFLSDRLFGFWNSPLEERDGGFRFVRFLPGSLQALLVVAVLVGTGNGTWKFIRVMCSEFSIDPTLDGLAYAFDPKRRGDMTPDDARAILWLLDQRRFHPASERRILEVPGNPYSIHGRVSVFSGIPTLVGWPNHEGIWNRGKPEALRENDRRNRDAKTIYSTPSFRRTRQLLDQYGITHVFWGNLERKEFGASAERKFRKYMEVAKQYGDTTVYSGYKEVPIRDTELEEKPPQPLSGAREIRSAEHPLMEPRGVCFGADGSIYVSNSKNGTVDRYSREGEFLQSFGRPGTMPGTDQMSTDYSGPGGVCVDSSGNVFVTDTWNHRVICFAPDGGLRSEIKADLFGPRDVVLFREQLVVSDTGKNRLMVFDPGTGTLLKSVGTKGSELGSFVEPVGLAVLKNNLYVADVGNGRIQVFDAALKPRFAFDVLGWKDQVWTEPYLAIDESGTVWTTDSGNSRLERFTQRGKLLSVFGPGCEPIGLLKQAKGIACFDGQLLISDFGNNRLVLCPVPSQ